MTTASHHATRDFTHRGVRYLAGEPFPASELGANVRGMEMARLIAVGAPPAAKAAKAAERRAELEAKAAAAAVESMTDDELEAATAPPREAAGRRGRRG